MYSNVTKAPMGLFDGLRGKKAKQPQETKSSDAFFLTSDEAKTFGNIDYMRTAKSVRKTFPATGGSKEGAEVIETVSSMEKIDAAAQNKAIPEPSLGDVNPIDGTKETRRRADANLNPFRSMAKDIRNRS
ncbi:hypothetical protein L3556_06215 [Candidatus Synechococcus calcipolaris G9]|uniref:Uncharacterized protein n=1 Tax=Candidatus Synechococcus calcipolaris G9 TaxID=1497997 RepID=A0ABT6EYF7_9SYNE|nr:hypothetical protein [Candidatus Synechococcus calcipolaris]MDG2990529.1 hypothetical protein [Candidatus Synechococcus calcipolaris G9]